MVKDVIVLGGGSAGFMAALALKVRLPHLRVTVIRSKDIGIIGVGEGSTVVLTEFLPLPSGGDTSYAGMVLHDGLLWVSYYASHEGKTSIYLAKVKLPPH